MLDSIGFKRSVYEVRGARPGRVDAAGRRVLSFASRLAAATKPRPPTTVVACVPMLSLAPRRATRLLLAHARPTACLTRSLIPLTSGPFHPYPYASARTFLSWFKGKPKAAPGTSAQARDTPLLAQDDLFHPFSKSPIPAIRARGEAIRQLAPCPVCASDHSALHAHTKAAPKAVKFECPDCGWPTHCSEAHWAADHEHQKYCARLREVNEDEHDLRSGRRMREFELPGTSCPRPY